MNEQRDACLECDRKRKRIKKANETEEKHNARLANDCERRAQRNSTETSEEHRNHFDCETEKCQERVEETNGKPKAAQMI
ncbi:3350_t:CDS:2, partial [Funneliformis caledonium]